MKELLKGYDEKLKPKNQYPFKTVSLYAATAFLVILIGIYMGNVLFGNRSYEVLRKLQKEKAFLYQDVEKLKNKNAELQKQYLERKYLDPDSSK